MEKISIIFVTAFKDIGRSHYHHYTRTNEEYFHYFINLANNIEYTLVVYLEESVRNELLKKNTFKSNIIFLNMKNVDTFYDKYLENDQEIIQSDEYKNKIPQHRKFNPEHIYSEYNFVNHNKINFVYHCSEKYPNYTFYSWIDFGCIRDLNNMPQNLNLSKLPEKVIYGCFKIPTERINEYDMLASDEIYIQGSSFIIHKKHIENFEKIYENKIIEWQKKCTTDDDQNLLLQLYFDNPDIFYLVKTDEWYSLYKKM